MTSNTFREVSDFILQRKSDDMPAAPRHAAALFLLDTLGITIASTPMAAGRIARDTASLLYGTNNADHSARMMFDGRKVSIAGAAFASATQTDNLDGHDGYNPSKGHIGVVVVPTLAALAEVMPDFSGADALAAVIIGYEIAGRAATSLHATVSDYHTSGAWNALGVVAMAARLRRMNSEQMRQAMGIAEYHGPRSQMMREIANPTMLHDGSGMGAMIGVSSIVLAENGFTGAPAITIEADKVANHWEDLGIFWQMEHQYIKPYPICRWAHASIDAVRELMLNHELTHEDIAAVQVNSFREAACLFSGMPDTTSKAQYSMGFAVAVMIAYGNISANHVVDENLNDPFVASILQRIKISQSEKHSSRFPLGRWADVQITLNNGRVLDSGDIHARGGPEAPLNEDEIINKFMAYSVPTIGEERAGKIVQAVFNLLEEGSMFSDLGRLLYDAPSS